MQKQTVQEVLLRIILTGNKGTKIKRKMNAVILVCQAVSKNSLARKNFFPRQENNSPIPCTLKCAENLNVLFVHFIAGITCSMKPSAPRNSPTKNKNKNQGQNRACDLSKSIVFIGVFLVFTHNKMAVDKNGLKKTFEKKCKKVWGIVENFVTLNQN